VSRIVSLIASATEIVCSLGFEKHLVGRSHECDFPSSVQALPICTAPKFNIDGSSYEIDQRVKAIVQEGLSVYRVDGDTLRRLRPDVIVTQSQCEVCAVSERDVQQAVCDWIEGRPNVVSLKPDCLADVWKDIRIVAQALGAPAVGEDLVNRLQSRIAAIAERTRRLSARPTVACVEWIEPLMASGNWMPELVELAGGVNLFGVAGQHAPWMKWEHLVERDPEVILVLPCGFDIGRTRQEMPALVGKLEWSRLRAVRAGRVFLLDGNQYFNRPGPRLVESLEILVEILHQDLFRFGHQGVGWDYL
jgi:iron complex transport system substrate-binding protein